jgi:type III restriction enzyme
MTSTERDTRVRHRCCLLYKPDFIVRLVNDLSLLLEIKGYEVHNPWLNDANHGATRRWVTAVNNLGEFGRWDFLVRQELASLDTSLKQLAALPPTSICAPVR